MPKLVPLPRFRRKPTYVFAFRWTGDNAFEVMRWADACAKGSLSWSFNGDGTITIPTNQGPSTAIPLDWIICGPKGEFYPCKPDIFADTYEPET